MANTDTANANANAMRGATSANDPSPNGLGPADVPGGESGYEPWYPSNVATGSSVRAFISRFYQISDDSGRDEEWVNCFDAGATVMIGNEVANGKQGQCFVVRIVIFGRPFCLTHLRFLFPLLQRSVN